MVIVRQHDVDWLNSKYPNLYFDASKQAILGELDFCAEYDKHSKTMKVGGAASRRPQTIHICDIYEIEVRVGPADISPVSGWPKVYEVGGKLAEIERKTCANLADLHFFSNRSCCLGIRFTRDENLTIDKCLQRLVVPFFFRLSYVNRYGLSAAQRDLWNEHSHSEKGKLERFRELLRFTQLPHGTYAACPCGSMEVYSKCCLNDVKLVIEIVRPYICVFRRFYTIGNQKCPVVNYCAKCRLNFCPLIDTNKHQSQLCKRSLLR